MSGEAIAPMCGHCPRKLGAELQKIRVLQSTRVCCLRREKSEAPSSMLAPSDFGELGQPAPHSATFVVYSSLLDACKQRK